MEEDYWLIFTNMELKHLSEEIEIPDGVDVSLDNNKLIIKNFFGEKVPRKAKILEGVDVKIEGDIITVTGVDKEKVGQTSANMEKSTRITNRDRRVFMDGIYIIDKGGKKIH